jgi:hypothetical protein
MTTPLLLSVGIFGAVLAGFIIINWTSLSKRASTLLLSIVVLIGIVTGLLNHGTDDVMLRWIDRAFMAISALAFLIVLMETRRLDKSKRTLLFGLMIATILFYVGAKAIATPGLSDLSHIATHACATAFVIATLTSLTPRMNP